MNSRLDGDLRTWIAVSREKVYHNRRAVCCTFLTRHSPIGHAIQRAMEWNLEDRLLHALIDCYDAFVEKYPHEHPLRQEQAILLALVLVLPSTLTKEHVREWLFPRDSISPGELEETLEMVRPILDVDALNLWDYVQAVGLAARNGPRTQTMAQYFAEMVQFNGGMAGCTRGTIACLCVLVARLHIPEDCGGGGANAWPPEMVDLSGLGLGNFQPHMDVFSRLIRIPESGLFLNESLLLKYKATSRGGVGEIPLLSPEELQFAVNRERVKETLREKCRQIIRRNVNGDVRRLPLPSCLIRMME